MLTCGCERVQPAKWVAPENIAGKWQTPWYTTEAYENDVYLGELQTRDTIWIEQNGESVKMTSLSETEGRRNTRGFPREGTYRDGVVHVQDALPWHHYFQFLSEDRMVHVGNDPEDVNDDPQFYADFSDNDYYRQ